ncbi:MAG: hypothetical protein MZW92_45550 [Comamonadaceae bacterium]|nr:hypothetical protein [Comamonadaceae bacterium]
MIWASATFIDGSAECHGAERRRTDDYVIRVHDDPARDRRRGAGTRCSTRSRRRRRSCATSTSPRCTPRAARCPSTGWAPRFLTRRARRRAGRPPARCT